MKLRLVQELLLFQPPPVNADLGMLQEDQALPMGHYQTRNPKSWGAVRGFFEGGNNPGGHARTHAQTWSRVRRSCDFHVSMTNKFANHAGESGGRERSCGPSHNTSTTVLLGAKEKGKKSVS